MSGTEVVIREPRRVELSTDQLKYISGTEFVPPGLRSNLPAILACVATGRELGIGDMVALRSIHIIDGKATFSAELMVQLVRRAGHSISGEVNGDGATVTGIRADNGDTMTMTWTLAMAERAGLLSKSNWKKYPEAMLWARAVSQLCRMLFADCFAGNTYTSEELGDGDQQPVEETEDDLPFIDAQVAEAVALPAGDEEPIDRALRVNDQQLKLLWATITSGKLEEAQFRPIVLEVTGQESTRRIMRHQFDEVLTRVKALVASPVTPSPPAEDGPQTLGGGAVTAAHVAQEPSSYIPPSGRFAAGGADGPATLAEIHARGADGEDYLRMCLRQLPEGEWRTMTEAFCAEHMAEVLA